LRTRCAQTESPHDATRPVRLPARSSVFQADQVGFDSHTGYWPMNTHSGGGADGSTPALGAGAALLKDRAVRLRGARPNCDDGSRGLVAQTRLISALRCVRFAGLPLNLRKPTAGNQIMSPRLKCTPRIRVARLRGVNGSTYSPFKRWDESSNLSGATVMDRAGATTVRST
jgi:hypothetical protein